MSEHLTPQPNTRHTQPRTVTLPLEEWHSLLRLLIGKAPIYCASERGRFVASIVTQLATDPTLYLSNTARAIFTANGLRCVESWLTTHINDSMTAGEHRNTLYYLREAVRLELSSHPDSGDTTDIHSETPHP